MHYLLSTRQFIMKKPKILRMTCTAFAHFEGCSSLVHFHRHAFLILRMCALRRFACVHDLGGGAQSSVLSSSPAVSFTGSV